MKHYSQTLLVLLILASCSGGGGRHSEWEDLDYSRVYQRAGQRENDPGYTQPTITACVDDDLYNCK